MTPARAAAARRTGRALLPALPLLVLAGALAASGAEGSLAQGSMLTRPLVRARPLLGGVDVGEVDLERLARGLRAQGLDTLQVSHEVQLGEWDRATLDMPAAPLGGLRARVRAARRAGLAVMLVLRVRLDPTEARNRHLWHGLIWPRDDELHAFFQQYRALVLEAARLAQDEGVAMLVVGNELNALTSTAVDVPSVLARALDHGRLAREAAALRGCESEGPVRWHDGGVYPDLAQAVRGEERALAAWAAAVAGPVEGRRERLRARRRAHDEAFRAIFDEARAHYDGLLSYGAGFDSYAEVGFWDATDALVTTAYFGLRDADQPADSATLVRAWTQHLRRLAQAAAARPARPALPVYFGELGFTRRAASSVRPWSYEGFEVLPRDGGASTCVEWSRVRADPSERVRALDALATALRAGALPSLRGFSLWKLTLSDAHWELEPYAIRLTLAEQGEATGPARTDAETLRAVQRLGAALAPRLSPPPEDPRAPRLQRE